MCNYWIAGVAKPNRRTVTRAEGSMWLSHDISGYTLRAQCAVYARYKAYAVGLGLVIKVQFGIEPPVKLF